MERESQEAVDDDERKRRIKGRKGRNGSVEDRLV